MENIKQKSGGKPENNSTMRKYYPSRELLEFEALLLIIALMLAVLVLTPAPIGFYISIGIFAVYVIAKGQTAARAEKKIRKKAKDAGITLVKTKTVRVKK